MASTQEAITGGAAPDEAASVTGAAQLAAMSPAVAPAAVIAKQYALIVRPNFLPAIRPEPSVCDMDIHWSHEMRYDGIGVFLH